MKFFHILLCMVTMTHFALPASDFAYPSLQARQAMTDRAIKQKLTAHGPQQIEFAWDIHDVLMQPNKGKMAKAIVKHGGSSAIALGFRLLGDKINYAFTQEVGQAEQLFRDIKQAMKNSGTAQTCYPVLNAYDPVLAEASLKVAAQLSPIPGMSELITELHIRGYTQRVCSNIGTQEFVRLKKKHRTLFEKFDGGKTVSYSADGTPSTKKPEINYFIEYQNMYNPDRSKTIIFIDDKIENVIAAEQAGFVAILFISAVQLRADLKRLGVHVDNY